MTVSQHNTLTEERDELKRELENLRKYEDETSHTNNQWSNSVILDKYGCCTKLHIGRFRIRIFFPP